MTIVAGVDFGTESVRVAIVDHAAGVIGSGTAGYEVHRRAGDPDFATQSHRAHLEGLERAMHSALADAKVDGSVVAALAIDTTGSTVVVVGAGLQPLDDYYLWCDHRAKDEAARITDVAREEGLPAIDLCGGTYSSEWGFAKLLHWLRQHPDRRGEVVAAMEHCDLMAAVLCGIREPRDLPRSACAMGHKWLWSAAHGGMPSDDFLGKVDPLLGSANSWLAGQYGTSYELAGTLTEEWAQRLRLRAGIPIPIGALDAHWDAVGAGIAEGDVVSVIGSSTCIMALARSTTRVPGVCGVVPGSIHPDAVGIEAGLSATGQLFDAIATRAGTDVSTLARDLSHHRAGSTGLLRLPWDNGDRTVLVNPRLGGVTLGWNLAHTAADELFAAIEGTAFHTRIILDRMREHGVPTQRLIHAGGIPQRSEVLNQVYANVMGMPVLVPERPATSLGAAIFAFVAAGAYDSVGAAQRALCPAFRTVLPDESSRGVYERLFPHFRDLYHGLGNPGAPAVALGHVLPTLMAVAREASPA
ncbi:MAG: ribulokinase [Cytophagaceae bacterium]|nr:ribulokinase [Gemmatimonadaceae bacterium]